MFSPRVVKLRGPKCSPHRPTFLVRSYTELGPTPVALILLRGSGVPVDPTLAVLVSFEEAVGEEELR